MFSWILFLIAIVTFLFVPVLIIWGWVRWSKNKNPGSIFPTLSFIGFCFATASALLGLFSRLYAQFIRSFPFYDPTLMRIYACGGLLSLAAILFAIVGVWRRGPVRWHAPLCAIGTLLFWIIAMSTE